MKNSAQTCLADKAEVNQTADMRQQFVIIPIPFYKKFVIRLRVLDVLAEVYIYDVYIMLNKIVFKRIKRQFF